MVDLPLDANHEDKPLFGRDVERTLLLGQTRKTDLLSLLFTVFLDVLLGALEDDLAFFLVGLDKSVLIVDVSPKVTTLATNQTRKR